MSIIITINRFFNNTTSVHQLFEIAYIHYRELSANHKIIFMNPYETEAELKDYMKKYNHKKCFDETVSINGFTEKCNFESAENWSDISEQITLKCVEDISKIYVLGGQLDVNQGLCRGGTSSVEFFDRSTGFRTIHQFRDLMCNIIVNAKIARKFDCELHHFLYDPQEFDYNDVFHNINYKRYFQYSSDRFNFSKCDVYTKSLMELYEYGNHKYDFTFGYTASERSRSLENYGVIAKQMDGLETNLFIRDRFRRINTSVHRSEYLDNIAKSDFTLIIPAYETASFSIFRYLESVILGCIPIILDTNDLSEVSKEFNIPDELICNIKDVRKTMDKLRNQKHLIVSNLYNDITKGIINDEM